MNGVPLIEPVEIAGPFETKGPGAPAAEPPLATAK